MCVKEHIYRTLAARRRHLGMSQQDLGARAGIRREKVSRIESQAEDVSFADLCKLLDALGLEISVSDKHEFGVPPELSRSRSEPGSVAGWRLAPQSFEEAAFVDGAKAKVVKWGKVPR